MTTGNPFTRALPDKIQKDLKKNGMAGTPPLPASKCPPNKEHLQQWVDAQLTPKLRELAQKMADNIDYKSFDEVLLPGLLEICKTLKYKINANKYVLVLGKDMQEYSKIASSDAWIASLLLHHQNGLPIDNLAGIVKPAQLVQFLLDNPDVNCAVMIDDAIYSGTQKANALDKIKCDDETNRLQNVSLFVATVCATEEGLNNVKTQAKNTKFKEFDCWSQHQIKTLDKIFDDADKQYIENLWLKLSLQLTLTYFDHKFPDFMSTDDHIYEGKLIHYYDTAEKILNFLGYNKTNSPNYTEKLQALDFRRPLYGVGYNIPYIATPYKKNKKHDPEITNPIQGHGSDAMPTTTWQEFFTLEKQKEFDAFIMNQRDNAPDDSTSTRCGIM